MYDIVCMNACDNVQCAVCDCSKLHVFFCPKDIGVNCTQLTFCERSPKLREAKWRSHWVLSQWFGH